MKKAFSAWTSALAALALLGCSDDARQTIEGPAASFTIPCPETGPLTGASIFSHSFVMDTMFSGIGLDVGIDGAGNTVVAGSFRKTVDPGGGPLVSAGGYDFFVAEYDPSGKLLWNKRFGGADDERLGALAVSEKGDIWIVSNDSSISVTALDPAGELRFSRSYTGADYQNATAAAVDREGNLLLVGDFEGGDLDFGLGRIGSYGRHFLVKLDPAGKTVFARALAGSSDNGVSDVAAAPDGEIVMAGSMKRLSLDGVEGLTAGGTDAFVARLSANGEARWIRRFGGKEWDDGYKAAVDALGNTWLTGNAYQSFDLGDGPIFADDAGAGDFVVELDPTGHPLRHRMRMPSYVRADGAGNVVLAGEFTGSLEAGATTLVSAGGSDAWLVKLGRAGDVRWAQRTGGAKSERVHGLASNCEGRSAIVGSRLNPNDPNGLSPDGPIEVFVESFAP